MVANFSMVANYPDFALNSKPLGFYMFFNTNVGKLATLPELATIREGTTTLPKRRDGYETNVIHVLRCVFH